MSLDDCLAKAEFFSLHMPLTPQTKVLAAMQYHLPAHVQQRKSGHIANCDTNSWTVLLNVSLLALTTVFFGGVAEPLWRRGVWQDQEGRSDRERCPRRRH
jgi:hypothetical protein